MLDSADTDVYVAAATVSHQFPGDLLIKKEGGLICCRSLFPDYLMNCIIIFHFLTGCDANSAFYGKGKRAIFEKINLSEKARHQIENLGDHLNIPTECKKKRAKL